MAGYWPRSFFAFLWTFVSVHKNAKKELGQYPAILTSRLVNNAYNLGPSNRVSYFDNLNVPLRKINSANCSWQRKQISKSAGDLHFPLKKR